MSASITIRISDGTGSSSVLPDNGEVLLVLRDKDGFLDSYVIQINNGDIGVPDLVADPCPECGSDKTYAQDYDPEGRSRDMACEECAYGER